MKKDQNLEDFMDNREKRIAFAFMSLDRKKKKRKRKLQKEPLRNQYIFYFVFVVFLATLFFIGLKY
jgi:hypothetical protein